ncbi:hypothetical protein MHSWG343_10140 [Candidatus Mycoplasma haematohominis]|uniref:Uncharacterized protein n=1 Tax=Candidatus Mycoplasma haematohominis TaxID=1494318 RepID=A0A478FUJ6_9MOLU|nr:hypothetical protein MHSWG343_10140 [Candidatus Mycoplasma haemohominis]
MDWRFIRYGLGGLTLIGSIVTVVVFQQGSLNQDNKDTPPPKPYAALFDWAKQKNRKYIGNDKQQIISQLNEFKNNFNGNQYRQKLLGNFEYIQKSLPDNKLDKQTINQAQTTNPKASEEWADFVQQWCELKARDETIVLQKNGETYQEPNDKPHSKTDLGVFKDTCTQQN